MHCVSTALEGSPIQNDQVMMLPVEKEKKNHFATLRFELSNQGCEGRHSRKVIFALFSPKTRRSVRRLVLGLKRRLVKIRDVWWVIGWRWREAKGAKRTKRTKILKGG
jgi:hypothetical protein